MIKILIAEQSPIVTAGLMSCLDNLSSLSITTTDSADRLLEKSLVCHPEIIIMNPSILLADKNILKQLRHEIQGIKIIAMVYSFVESQVLRSFDDIIEISDCREKIIATIRNSNSDNERKNTDNNVELSARETDVLVAVAKGLMNKEISDQLHISIHTVISHRKNITKKTGIKSVSGLTVYALLNNLIDESEVVI